MTDAKVTVTVPVKLKVEHLKDILRCALEQGIDYWCGAVWPDRHSVADEPGFWDLPFTEGRHWRVKETEGEDGDVVWHTLNLDKLRTGIELMAEKCPYHFADLFSECGGDAITADVLVQMAVFGDIRYS